MTSLFKHIAAILLGLCTVLLAQNSIAVGKDTQTFMILSVAACGTVLLTIIAAHLNRKPTPFKFILPVALYAAVLTYLTLNSSNSSGVDIALGAGMAATMAATSWIAARSVELVREVDELGALLLFEGRLKSVVSPEDYLVCGEKMLAQCQRNHRPLAVVAIKWKDRENSEEFLAPGIAARVAKHLRRRELIAAISDNLRNSDIMLCNDRADRCFLVCPDTELASVSGFCKRLDAAIAERLVLNISFGVAHFGEAGYSLIELLTAAAERADSIQSDTAPRSDDPAPTTPRLTTAPDWEWSRKSANPRSVAKTAR